MPKAQSITEVIAGMPKYFLPEQAAGMNAVIQLELTGDGGGQWNISVAGQQLQIAEGIASEPNMTLEMEAADYLALVNREATAIDLFMKGKVKVHGDMQLALKLQSLFKRPE